ncbi:MAG TPA: FABP family protein, partial [Casimicrobium sp.]|nr:FABP family protein [Casimicrobium sp.]
MSEFPKDIYTEPEDPDVDTMANLGPLTGMAGIWQGTRGLDTSPKED